MSRILALAFLALPFGVGCSSSTATPATDGGAADASLNHIIGESCRGTTDCATGLLCAGEDPGGQCYKTCAPSKDSDCGDTTKYACSSEGHCYVKCSVTSDCKRAAEGYVCEDDDPPRAGVKFCDVAPAPEDGGTDAAKD